MTTPEVQVFPTSSEGLAFPTLGLLDLPNELLCLIFSYSHRALVRQVCKILAYSLTRVNIYQTFLALLEEKNYHLLPYIITEGNRELLLGHYNRLLVELPAEMLPWLGSAGNKESLGEIIRAGRADSLAWLQLSPGFSPTTSDLNLALRLGRIEIAQTLIDNCFSLINEETLTRVCGLGPRIFFKSDRKPSLFSYSELILEMIAFLPRPFHSRSLNKALKKKQMNVVDWLVQRKHYCPHDATAVAVRNFNLLKELYAQGEPLTVMTAWRAPNLETLQWLRKKGCPWDERVCWISAAKGDYARLKWSRQGSNRKCPWNSGTSACLARKGEIEMLQWALQKGCPYDEGVPLAAVEGGHIKVLEWLEKRNRLVLSQKLTERAAKCRQTEILYWLVEKGAPLSHLVSAYLVKTANKEALLWSLAKGFPLGSLSALYALGQGEDIFRLLIEAGCPVNNKVWIELIRVGSLSLLKWFLEREECTINALHYCALYGRLDSLSWLLEKKRLPLSPYLPAYACASGAFHILGYLERKGVKFNGHCTSYACKAGRLDVLKWLFHQGAPLTKASFSNAAREGHTEILDWLKSKGCPPNKRALRYAQRQKNKEVLDSTKVKILFP